MNLKNVAAVFLCLILMSPSAHSSGLILSSEEIQMVRSDVRPDQKISRMASQLTEDGRWSRREWLIAGGVVAVVAVVVILVAQANDDDDGGGGGGGGYYVRR